MPFLYVTVFLILFEKTRCEDYVFGVIQDVNTTCISTQDCNRRFGGSARVCVEAVCVCKSDYYESSGICLHCSAFQESCEVSKCCAFSMIATCVDNVCKCKYNNDQTDFSSCWRRSQGKHNILSFAKLLLGAILALSLAALFGILRQLCNRPDVIESSTGFQRSFPYESFNSIQRYVMQKLKDRPPRYEDIQKECANGSPSNSSHNVWGNRTCSSSGAQGSLPPSYQSYSAPSPSVDMTLPPPPYTSAPYEPDLYIPPESYTRTLESTPLVFQISSQNGLNQGRSNPHYQSTETGSSTIISSNTSFSSISEASSSSTLPSAPPPPKKIQSNNTLPSPSKLPSYSQLEIVLSPKSMNEHYMSLESQKRSQNVDESAQSDQMEYQIGDDMTIVSRVIDREKLNVVNGKLKFDASIESSDSNSASKTCASKVTIVEHNIQENMIAKGATITSNANTNNINEKNLSLAIEDIYDLSRAKEITTEYKNSVCGDSNNKKIDVVDITANTCRENAKELTGSFIDNIGTVNNEMETNLVATNSAAQENDLALSTQSTLDEKGNPTVDKITLVGTKDIDTCLTTVEINDIKIKETIIKLESRDESDTNQLKPEVQPHSSKKDDLNSISNRDSVEGQHERQSAVNIEEMLKADKTCPVNCDGGNTKETTENRGCNTNDSDSETSHLGVIEDNDLNSLFVAEIDNKTDDCSIHER